MWYVPIKKPDAAILILLFVSPIFSLDHIIISKSAANLKEFISSIDKVFNVEQNSLELDTIQCINIRIKEIKCTYYIKEISWPLTIYTIVKSPESCIQSSFKIDPSQPIFDCFSVESPDSINFNISDAVQLLISASGVFGNNKSLKRKKIYLEVNDFVVMAHVKFKNSGKCGRVLSGFNYFLTSSYDVIQKKEFHDYFPYSNLPNAYYNYSLKKATLKASIILTGTTENDFVRDFKEGLNYSGTVGGGELVTHYGKQRVSVDSVMYGNLSMKKIDIQYCFLQNIEGMNCWGSDTKPFSINEKVILFLDYKLQVVCIKPNTITNSNTVDSLLKCFENIMNEIIRDY